MQILVACEESQAVVKKLRANGHEAYSCDIVECSGGHNEWHIKQDVIPLLNGNTEFYTTDGSSHQINGKWDMIIAFPPCTHLAVSGAAWFKRKREDGSQLDAIEFFCKFLQCNCDRVAIENPVGIISGNYIKKWYPDICEKYGLPKAYSQVIQPYEFGHHARKKTCLWLKGLPNLKPTNIVDAGEIIEGGYSVGASAWFARDENGKIIAWNDPRTAIIRSKTYEGVAEAMANQWAGKV